MYYIISHTHWDREWFAPADITKKMLPSLFQKLFELIDNNPEYKFVLDGQMLIVKDYLSNFQGEERKKVENELKKYSKNIAFGPYYGQIDWRVSEESSIRNIILGRQEAKKYGNVMNIGWLLDNFGFSSQVAQINSKCEIEGCFLWRGLKVKFPKIGFTWSSPDGSKIHGIFLLDSYRNIMRLKDFPEVMEKRLELEINKLKKYSKTNYLPLLNGYDLDPVPEDPTDGELKTVFPDEFIQGYFKQEDPSLIGEYVGELMDGSVVSVFPGSLSTRQYLKIMNWHSEYMLSKVLEPLIAIADNSEDDKEIQKAWEYLIMNLVHDSIGGVGVDQIHEDMEERYNKIKEIFESTLNKVLDKVGQILPLGYTCLNLNLQEIPVLFEDKETLYRFSAPSGSLSKVHLKKYKVSYLEKPINSFHWENEHFKALVENGKLRIKKENNDYLIRAVLVEDKGDEYSSAFDKELNLTFSRMRLKARSDNYSKIALDFTSNEVDFTLYLTFSELPYINIEIESLGKGSDYGLLLSLIGDGDINAGVPFDSVKRPYEVKYEEPEEEMKKFLVAAREISFNNVFSMKDYAGLEKDDHFAAFMAKGIYSYTTHSTTSLTPFGAFSAEKAASLILLRSVSWLSVENVKGRIGDAGPVMYTPGAEVKRKMKIEAAFCISSKDNFLKYKNSFINPPLLFYKHSNNSGLENQAGVVHKFYSSVDENIEFVNMKPSIDKEGITLRFFNPTHKKKEIKLPQKSIKTDLLENELEEFDGTIKPKEILTLKIPKLSFNICSDDQGSKVNIVYPKFTWDISEDLSKPDIDIINNMEREAKDLKEHIKDLEKKIKESQGINRYELLFEKYKLMRKALELELSSLYNRSKIERVDPSKIEHIIVELNDVRIKRRGIEFLLATLK
ncbi:hypothetical protein X927_04105 [Petrotoga mexicana DSM 14811]|uniref:Glycoside hydrolase family 38 central domain-containing protein n=1 Tax=Petrotoga mexicana DSM 14811 TaxID=1122954 RepID=A0A2K1PBS7_9BACT|nr:glycosyl hydrolase-related protein [Petrotoga mexicana]PNS00255.1 hypothetical protein X927_04105 [Petrotoga mexicana DSM 14811]